MNPRTIRRALLAAAAGIALMATGAAFADRGHGGGWHGAPGGWAARPAPGGYWHYGEHRGAWGWWWVLPGAWWLYDRPYYPYPAAPPVVVQPVPQESVIVQPAPQPAAQTWYFCESARAYYPYVQTCAEGWRPVPAAPPPASGAQQSAPAAGSGGVQ